jgi:predicted RNase H-like HicB family nuclease
MKEYAIIIEKSRTGWSAYVPDLPGLAAAASTYEETERLIKTGIVLHIECLRDTGNAVPEPTTRVVMSAAA